MGEDELAADRDAVRRDLEALKQLLGGHSTVSSLVELVRGGPRRGRTTPDGAGQPRGFPSP